MAAYLTAHAADLWLTLTFWQYEVNPLVLALGPERWTLLKVGCLLGVCSVGLVVHHRVVRWVLASGAVVAGAAVVWNLTVVLSV